MTGTDLEYEHIIALQERLAKYMIDVAQMLEESCMEIQWMLSEYENAIDRYQKNEPSPAIRLVVNKG